MNSIKKLVKRMTFKEAVEYVKKHPKWVLPKEEILDREATYWLDSEIRETNNENGHIMEAKTNNGYVNILFKLPVYLIKNKDIKTGNLYYLNKNRFSRRIVNYLRDLDINETDDGFLINKEILINILNNKLTKDEKIKDLISALNENDRVLIK